jgi:hypothetical protein
MIMPSGCCANSSYICKGYLQRVMGSVPEPFIQHSRPKQAAGQLCGQLGAAKHLGHDLERLITEV